MSSLADLVRQSESLKRALPQDGPYPADHLPEVNLGLDQILESSAKLARTRVNGGGNASGGGGGGGLLGRSVAGNNGVSSQQGPDVGSAHYLLATQGVNLPGVSSQISNLNSHAAAATSSSSTQWEPSVPLADTDVDGYLRERKEMTIIAAIEETRRKTQQDARRAMRKKMSENWKMTKAKLFDEMGLQADTSTSNSLAGGSRLGAGSIFGLGLGSSMTTYGGNRSTSANGASSSSDVTAEIQSRMMAYDEVIKRLNARRKTKTPFAVITYMNARMAKGSGEKQALLSACLDVLAEVAGEGGATDAGEFVAGPVVERQHANAYLAAEGTDAKARSNRMIADASRRYLEGSFRRMVEKTLLDRQAEAKLGGSPSPINKMRAYSELVLRDSAGKQRLEEINKQYFWAQLYYLLRAGHIDEAVTLAEDVEYAMPRNDKAFVAWFRQWRQGDLRLPRDQRDRFVAEFNKRIRNTAEKGDPFRYAVWKIVGRAELSKKTVVGVTDTLEDWMWMQLHLVKEPVQGTIEAASDKYTLNDLGANVTKYGEAHFDPKGLRPLLYLQFLLLAGQFERGVEFLLSKARHEVDGVHLAIVLTYYGLLRLVSSSSSGVASSAPSPVVDFPRIIQRYIRSFYKSDAAAALQYAYLISLNSGLPAPTGPQQQEQCWDTVCNIILESRSYSLVLGQRTSEGQVLPSTVGRDMELVHVADKPAALKDLIRRVSARAPADMPLSDRIELYRATGESDSILRTLGQALSDSLEVPPQVNGSSSQQEGPDELVEYVRKMMLELETDRVTIDRKSVMTIDVLIALKDAKRKYDRGDFEATLETIRQINILPLDADVTGITRAADNFRDVDETISRRIDGVLLMAMRCLFEEHQKQKKSTHGGAGRLEKLQMLRRQSRALMMFAGMMRYRMSNETYTQLVQLDAFF